MTLAPPSPRVRGEGGVRGRRRCLSRAINAGPPRHSLSAQNRGEAPSTHPSLRTRGEGVASGITEQMTCALVLATHVRPRFADQSHQAFASEKIRGGGAPKRRNCPVGPRHASDVATQTRFGRGRAFSGTRSPFGAPPRFLLRRRSATAQSRPRFTRCSAQALPAPWHRA
jgi:hypothetical protein